MNDKSPSLLASLLVSQAPDNQSTLAHIVGLMLVFWLTLLPVLPVFAAPSREGVISNNTIVSYLWTPYSQTDGLISNNVTAILAQENVIWLTTDLGISRFDGTWSSFRSGIELPPGPVTVLAQLGADQALWIGTDLGYLGRWDGTNWLQQGTVGMGVHSLAEIDGRLWVGTASGIMIWTRADLTDPTARGAAAPLANSMSLPPQLLDTPITALAQDKTHIYVGTRDGLWSWDREIWTQITEEDGLPSRSITAIWTNSAGAVWVGTQAGAARFMAETDSWYPFPTEDANGLPVPVLSLQGDNKGAVWAASEVGAFQFTENNQTIQLSGDVGLTTAYVQAVAPDDDGHIWLGTVAGVFHYSLDTWIFERRNDVEQEADGRLTYYLGTNYINALLVDSRNGLWVATNGAGVRFKVADVNFSDETYYTQANSNLPSILVKALAEDAQGDVWAGTQEGVARFRDNQWIIDIPVADLPSPDVLSLAATPTGMWVGTERGLAFYATQSGKATQLDDLADQAVTALALDGMGRLWVGTRDQGIFLESPDGSFAPAPHVENLMGRHVVSLAPDPNNLAGMWVGIYQQGIDYWDGQQWESLTSAQGLPSNVVHTVFTTPGDAGVWIGSEAGVTRYDGRSWGTFDVKDGKLSPSVLAVAHSQTGGFWFGGRDGLTFYSPDKTPPWARIKTVSGLTVLDAAPDLSAVTLQLDADTLNVEVAAGDLHTNQEELSVLYRWSGPDVDDAWLPLNGRQIVLPAPAPGDYLLEIEARDDSFNYSPIASTKFNFQSAPTIITLPVIGSVRVQTFQILLTLALVAFLAFAYVSNEIIQGRRRVREAMVRGYNPYISGEPVRREDMFFGREELLQRIVDTLHNNSIMIHGERRIGKTTLLYQLGSRLREVDDPEFWFIPVYADLEGTTQEGFFHFLMEEIVSVVRLLPGDTTTLFKGIGELDMIRKGALDYTDRNFSRDLRHLLQSLTVYGQVAHPDRKLRLILLLDEMDVMSHYDHLVQQQLRRTFMRDFAATLGAVVAGIQISKAWDRVESPWYNLFNEIKLEPFDRDQAAQLLTEAVRDIYTYDQAAVEAIIDYSDGRPFRLQQYGLEAVNHMLSENRRRITLTDVEVAHVRIQEQIEESVSDQANGTLADVKELIPGAISLKAVSPKTGNLENSTIDLPVEDAYTDPMGDSTSSTTVDDSAAEMPNQEMGS